MSFDHRAPGTDPAAWTTFLAGVEAGPVDLAGVGSVVVVAPHPDDETLGAGGLIATAADAGTPVHVLLVTAGEGSHPDSPTTTPDALVARRRAEFRTALAVLHPAASATETTVPDGGLREHRDEVGRALAARLAGAARPTLVVAPWRGDGHRDHRIAGEVAEELVAATPGTTLLSYPVWTWHWDTPDASAAPWGRARVLPLDADVRDRKARALAAYPSQTAPLSPAPGDEAVVDDRHAAHHLRAEEWFFAPEERADETVPGPDTTSATTTTTGTEPPTSGVDTPTSGTDTGAVPTAASSRSRASFDEHYARKPEGWDFDGSWYERRKRAVTLAALPRERFRSALELGCATGVLTAALTDRADAVLGTDIAAAPLVRARLRAPAARFEQAAFPAEWPTGRWDLVVLSEVGYYLSPDDLDRTVDRVLAALDGDGVLVTCHWRHPDDEAVSDGDTVDARIAARWPGPRLVHHVEDDFVLSVFPGPDVRSVARTEGLAP